ncbi:MAG: hypothetical protein WA618_15250 [Terriglobales bacterium]
MATPKDPTLCTKDGCDLPRTSNKSWCKKHLAEYQKDYVDSKEGRAESKGFVRGANAMREYLVGQLYRMGNSSAAELVKGAPMPKLDG